MYFEVITVQCETIKNIYISLNVSVNIVNSVFQA